MTIKHDDAIEKTLGNKKSRTVVVEVRSVYGRDLIYPVNAVAQVFCEISQRDTLTRSVMEHLSELGYSLIIHYTVGTARPEWLAKLVKKDYGQAHYEQPRLAPAETSPRVPEVSRRGTPSASRKSG